MRRYKEWQSLLQALVRSLSGLFHLPLWLDDTQSRTDGKQIWVEREPWFFRHHELPPAIRLRCLRGIAVHELYHIWFSDFEAWDAFLNDPDLQRRFHPEVLTAFGNGAEDGRIELRGVNRLPGTLEWLQLTNLLAVKAMKPSPDPVAALLQGFVAKMVAGILPPNYEGLYPQWVQLLEELAPLMERARHASSTEACLQVVRLMLDQVEPYLPSPEQAPAEEESLGASDLMPGLMGGPDETEIGKLDPHIKPMGKSTGGDKEKAESDDAAAGYQSAVTPLVDEHSQEKGTTEQNGLDGSVKGRAEASDSDDEEPIIGSEDTAGDDSLAGHKQSCTGSPSTQPEANDHKAGVTGSRGADEAGSQDAGQSEGGDQNHEAKGESQRGEENPSQKAGPQSPEERESTFPVASCAMGNYASPYSEQAIEEDEILRRLMHDAQQEEEQAIVDAQRRIVAESDHKEAATGDDDRDEVKRLARLVSERSAEHRYVRLEQQQPAPLESVYQTVLQETAAVREGLYRALKVLVKKENSNYLGGRRSGSLQVGRLWRVNSLADTRVFQKKLTPYDPAVACYFLVDSSGSMSGRDSIGAVRPKIDMARMALVALADTLDRLGIVHAATAFYASNEPTVIHRRLLKWGQKAGRATSVAFDPRGNNRDGFSLRVAAKELQRRPEPLKLLFVLSDGQPASWNYDGYSKDCNGVRDTAAAVQEATKAGINVIAFYFGDRSPQRLEIELSMFGRSRLVVVNNLTELPYQMAGVLKRIVLRHKMV